MTGMRNDIEDILAISDCVLIPSQEGLSLVALEAIAASCKVVTSRQYGAYELLQNAECGTFYETDATSVDVAESILNAINEQGVDTLLKGIEYCKKMTFPKYKEKLFKLFS